MLSNKKIVKIMILVVLFIVFIGSKVNADNGPKPSITICLKNMNTTNYKIDLLTQMDENQENIVSKYKKYKEEPIYKYDKDGWVATCLRNPMLWGDIEGNESKTHFFTYFGVPNEFKIIIQGEDGTIKTSNVIRKMKIDDKIYLDVNTMKATEAYEVRFLNIFECILITVVIEVLIALIMNMKHIKAIILTNIFTQILIQSLRILNFDFILSFFIAEILVFAIEYMVYKKLFKDMENNKILKYTLIANFVTAMLTFVNNIPIFLLLIILFIIYSICNRKKLQYKLSNVIWCIALIFIIIIVLLFVLVLRLS